MQALPRHRAILIASVLGALALSCPWLWPLGPVALGAFFYSLWQEAGSGRGALLYGAFFGLTTAAAGILWCWQMLPFDWFGVPTSSGEAYAVGIVWILVSAALAIPVALVGWIMYRIRTLPIAVFATPLLWLLAEYGKMWAFALISYGNQSLLGPHFSITAFGYLFAESPYLLQLAFPYGIWGLTFMVAGIGSFLATVARERRALRWPTCLLGLLVFIILCIPLFEIVNTNTGHSLRVAVLATEQHTDESPDTASIYLGFLKNSASSTPDLVVMPEGKSLGELLTPTGRTSLFSSTYHGRDVLIASAGDIVDAAGDARSTLFYDTATTTLATYTKLFLMPIGEYQPQLSQIIFRYLADAQIKRFFQNWRFSLRGDSLVAISHHGVVIGGLLCSDSFSPSFAKTLARKYGARIIVNPSNPTWFHSSRLLYEKGIEIAKVHAVESRIYYIEANQGSASFIISPQGKVIAESAWNADGYVVADLSL